MRKRSGILYKLLKIFVFFGTVIMVLTMVAIYFIQLQSFNKRSLDRVMQTDDYMASMIVKDAATFKNFAKYFNEHCDDIVVPLDYTEYTTALQNFTTAFDSRYPGQTLGVEVHLNELPEDLQNLFYTYYLEYWTITFNTTAEKLGIAYCYLITCNEEDRTCRYMFDPLPMEDENNPGFIDVGWQGTYDDPQFDPIWRVWEAGVPMDDSLVKWNNQYGHTFAYYYPLVIDGEKIGLLVSEIDVDTLNTIILKNTIKIALIFAAIYLIGELAMVAIINKWYVEKVHFLAEKIGEFGSTRSEKTIAEIKECVFTKDEVGKLADETVFMMQEICEHENELEKAARMKSDFLANMRHEIRTPMNAVIGMAELSLREKNIENIKGYIGQIKSSGRLLLAIINDILDFSKIESGRFEIIPVNYVPASTFNDVSNIVLMRLGNKNVNFDLNLPADLPATLNGDNIRIRQILINLVGNAVKFTNEGRISVDVSFSPNGDDEIMLKISVTDTGIGIKEDDLKKLFDSFSQLDTKRNRSVEGTGLGLAISKRLVKIMNGTMSVESTYGVGSTFTFEIPQKVVDNTPGVVVKNPDGCVAVACFSDEETAGILERDSEKLGVNTVVVGTDDDFNTVFRKAKKSYPDKTFFIFTDEERYDRISYFLPSGDDKAEVVLFTGFDPRTDISRKNMVCIRKPISVLAISHIFNRESVSSKFAMAEDVGEFIAPDANVLLVDDNAVNLTVAEGLLEPLKMNVMTAASGEEAIELTKKNRFDIIFMDHMMPEMDGVEATHRIRNENPEYRNIPIVALTANAIGDAYEMFMKEGMDGFVAKPIEVRNFISTVRKFLPPDKIVSLKKESSEAAVKDLSVAKDSLAPEVEEKLVIGNLNIDAAIGMLGSKKLYLDVLNKYYRVMDSKAEVIKKAYDEEDWEQYTIEVHALKSSSRQIGALELASDAEQLENAGKKKDIGFIRANTESLLNLYSSYKPVLAEYFGDSAEGGDSAEELTEDMLKELLSTVETASENLDMDAMEKVTETIKSTSHDKKYDEALNELLEAVESFDFEKCLEIREKIKSIM
jgi:signal transduction histidine kinase/response regulator RpfG family c-di-GMP phosphodiesterase